MTECLNGLAKVNDGDGPEVYAKCTHQPGHLYRFYESFTKIAMFFPFSSVTLLEIPAENIELKHQSAGQILIRVGQQRGYTKLRSLTHINHCAEGGIRFLMCAGNEVAHERDSFSDRNFVAEHKADRMLAATGENPVGIVRSRN